MFNQANYLRWMRCHFHLIAVIATLVLLAGCNTRVDHEHRSQLEDMAKQSAAQDMPLTGKLDLSRPAVLTLYHGDSDSLHPSCNGYCLRLLYGGEAKTVISGYLADVAVLRRAEVSGEWWRDPFIDAPGTKASVMAYHLEKRPVCPNAWHEESGPFLHRATDSADLNRTAAQLADLNMVAGLCLIGEKAQLNEVSMVVTITESTTSVSEEHLQFDVMHLTVFVPSDGGFIARYRKTVSVYSYLPQFLPVSFDDAQFKVTTATDPRHEPEILRQDLGWRLADLTTSGVDLRTATDVLLNDVSLTDDSPRWWVIDDYLRGLARPGGASPEDIAVLQRIVVDTRVQGHLNLLESAVSGSKASIAPLTEPLLRAMVADRSLPAGLPRLADAFVHMPADAVHENQELLLQLVADRQRIRRVPRVISQLAAVDPQRAVPVLSRILEADADPEATRMAMQAACNMGTGAVPLRPAVQTWLAHHSEPPADGDFTLSVTQRKARAVLANMVTPGTENCDLY